MRKPENYKAINGEPLPITTARNFGKCNFHGEDLNKRNFNCCSFRAANLTNTKLKEAQLREAIFNDAKLFETDLTKADLTNVQWIGVRLAKVQWLINNSTKKRTPTISQPAKIDYEKYGFEILLQNFTALRNISIGPGYLSEISLMNKTERYLLDLVTIIASKLKRGINAKQLNIILQEIGKVSLQDARKNNPHIKTKADLLRCKEEHAALAIDLFLPHIQINKRETDLNQGNNKTRYPITNDIDEKLYFLDLDIILDEISETQKPADRLKQTLEEIGKLKLANVSALNSSIKTKSDLLRLKKNYAISAVKNLLPEIKTIDELTQLKAIFDAQNDKKSRYAYLRREKGLLRIGKYGNTKTWFMIIGLMKNQLNEAYKQEDLQTDTKPYAIYYSMMNTHRKRSLFPTYRKTGSVRFLPQPPKIDTQEKNPDHNSAVKKTRKSFQ